MTRKQTWCRIPNLSTPSTPSTFLGLPRTRVPSVTDQAVVDCSRSKSPDFLHPYFRVTTPAPNKEFSFAEPVEAHQVHLTRRIDNEESSASKLKDPFTVTCGSNASATANHPQNINPLNVTPHHRTTSALSLRPAPHTPSQESNPPLGTRRKLQRKPPGGLRKRLSTFFQRVRPETGL